ncbi:pilus assembly protein PilZ [Pseudomonas sp. UBA6323]|uniref:pilus assembly protein PilZ n=1 Tax=Pseudomonas sp. UBA6323 TaxID=1947329 RepID=UPI0025D5FE7A|nr:pilus assembly protein PilZ [Pseudomonas sp. UBA6323]
MNRVQRALRFGWLTLAAWLAAQCVLQLAREPMPASAGPGDLQAMPGLLVGHWQAAQSDGLPLTRLPVEYVGGLRAWPASATVVVLRYGQQVRSYSRGQALAPGIVLQDIDDEGLILDNQGRRERLPWPPRPTVTGFKRQG